jgi:hypothetical protein
VLSLLYCFTGRCVFGSGLDYFVDQYVWCRLYDCSDFLSVHVFLLGYKQQIYCFSSSAGLNTSCSSFELSVLCFCVVCHRPVFCVVCHRPVFCVPNVASLSGLSIRFSLTFISQWMEYCIINIYNVKISCNKKNTLFSLKSNVKP